MRVGISFVVDDELGVTGRENAVERQNHVAPTPVPIKATCAFQRSAGRRSLGVTRGLALEEVHYQKIMLPSLVYTQMCIMHA